MSIEELHKTARTFNTQKVIDHKVTLRLGLWHETLIDSMKCSDSRQGLCEFVRKYLCSADDRGNSVIDLTVDSNTTTGHHLFTTFPKEGWPEIQNTFIVLADSLCCNAIVELCTDKSNPRIDSDSEWKPEARLELIKTQEDPQGLTWEVIFLEFVKEEETCSNPAQ